MDTISKELYEKISQLFEKLKKIDNINIIKIYSWFIENKKAYIIYEYCKYNLGTFLKSKRILEDQPINFLK